MEANISLKGELLKLLRTRSLFQEHLHERKKSLGTAKERPAGPQAHTGQQKRFQGLVSVKVWWQN